VLKDTLIEQIVNFTNFDDPQLEADCAELWGSEPGPRRRYIEIDRPRMGDRVSGLSGPLRRFGRRSI
jgi:hypothetical protein